MLPNQYIAGRIEGGYRVASQLFPMRISYRGSRSHVRVAVFNAAPLGRGVPLRANSQIRDAFGRESAIDNPASHAAVKTEVIP